MAQSRVLATSARRLQPPIFGRTVGDYELLCSRTLQMLF
jgi:hypothetical protein